MGKGLVNKEFNDFILSITIAAINCTVLIFWFVLFFTLAGPPESVYDWTRDNVSNSDQVSSRKHWRLVRCQNGKPFICQNGAFSFFILMVLYAHNLQLYLQARCLALWVN
jgi:hypothetical protein